MKPVIIDTVKHFQWTHDIATNSRLTTHIMVREKFLIIYILKFLLPRVLSRDMARPVYYMLINWNYFNGMFY